MRYLGEKYRCVVTDTFAKGIANVISNEEAIGLELFTEFLVSIRCSAHRQYVDDMSIVNVAGILDQSRDKMLRLATTSSYEYAVAGFNQVHRCCCSADFVLVFLCPVEFVHINLC